MLHVSEAKIQRKCLEKEMSGNQPWWHTPVLGRWKQEGQESRAAWVTSQDPILKMKQQ